MTRDERRNTATEPTPAQPANGPRSDFPVVGLGASAGGLEAIETFFRYLPPGTGIAFVLVAHLHPDRASLLQDILRRDTSMEVVEATDQMPLQPDRVHIIPPNRQIAVFHGLLQVIHPETPRGHRMPIDIFLRSLAEDQAENAVGIILSGTGSDGTLGLRAIHGAGGLCLVQDPATAQFPSMPNSAIQAGCATHVLPVEAMPAQLEHDLRHRLVPEHKGQLRSVPTGTINRILMHVRKVTGHDFSHYKENTVARRIQRRMAAQGIDDTESYARLLQEQPGEARRLFKELLISVTSFFREPEAFTALKRDILPELLAAIPKGEAFRAWVVGCSTGEEAYSIAMVLHEHMADNSERRDVQIYATDIDEDAIQFARAGRYPLNIVEDISAERLERYFTKEDTGYRVIKDIREMVVFAVQDVIKDPHFNRLELISCRNVLIYLRRETQDRLLSIFHYGLKPGGVLFLSFSESIGEHSDLFTPLERKWKFYRAIHSGPGSRAVPGHARHWQLGKGISRYEGAIATNPASIAEVAKRSLLRLFTPPSVVTDLRGNILYVHGNTSPYLGPAPGAASLDVIRMAREALQPELRTALQSAANQGKAVLRRGLPLQLGDETHHVDLGVWPIADPHGGENLLLVSFQRVETPGAGKQPRQRRPKAEELRRVEALERELAYTRDNLQASIEEEQAANEELQSLNEELQSTNEELETSREELQSTNEELVSVNAELHAKLEQMAELRNDLKNLLDTLDLGVILLDERLVVRRFTLQARRIFHLMDADVGRPLEDIRSDAEGADMLADARAVLRSLQPIERELRTRDGCWYLARVMPYRTLDQIIAGVVLTFTDISDRIAAERARRAMQEFAENIIDTLREPLVVLDGSMTVIAASQYFYRFFGLAPSETIGQSFLELADRQWDTAPLREALESLLPEDSSFDELEIDQVFAGMGRKRMLLSGRRLIHAAGESPLILLAMEDVTERPLA